MKYKEQLELALAEMRAKKVPEFGVRLPGHDPLSLGDQKGEIGPGLAETIRFQRGMPYQYRVMKSFGAKIRPPYYCTLFTNLWLNAWTAIFTFFHCITTVTIFVPVLWGAGDRLNWFILIWSILLATSLLIGLVAAVFFAIVARRYNLSRWDDLVPGEPSEC